MDSKTLREKFLNFFESRGHKILPSASLVPENDPSVLFTTAGMQSLVSYLLGEKHHSGERLVNIQKCIRTDDIEEIGDDSHLTFFEMLGYWSLGGYWKKEAIQYTFDFYTKEIGIDPKELAITCFRGDEKNGIIKDTESAEIWKSLGISEERIAFLDYADNFWGPSGAEGPCGPDTEIFVWTGEGKSPEIYDNKDNRWVEIGNDVFMEYNKKSDGTFEPLKQKNVDFGAGFERVLAYLEGKNNVFETDLFLPIINKIEEISGKKYQDNIESFRVIVDHIKASFFAINDGVLPSNKDAGYVVRRLIRRAIVKARQININKEFIKEIAVEVFEVYNGVYKFNEEMIISELQKEEEKFRQTLEKGLKIFESQKENLNGKIAFDLYQTYGFPWEMTVELAQQENIKIDRNEFEAEFKKHQDLSRTASAGMFKGGLQSGGEMETKYHTATHLLHTALCKVLGGEINQKGSNITAERLRFDFNYPEKLTDDQIKEVENIVNNAIDNNLPVEMTEMNIEAAKSSGAIGVFSSKYGDKVKVYSIDNFSKEICGGPHVKKTGELGHFKIIKEESSSAGIRRIKAILE